MRHRTSLLLALATVVLCLGAYAQKPAPSKDDPNSLVITFRDGRQQVFSMSDIARIEVNSSKATAVGKVQHRFLGKWKVGEGSGGTFYITLEEDGSARKSIGSSHGTWTTVDNEARISWDDGWHDAIRKVGSRFEKVAFAPGKTFTDKPENVTAAENTEPQTL